jgi:cysteine-rich repeat protein
MIRRLLIILICLTGPAAARAAVDMTGSWTTTLLGPGDMQVDIVQSGTALTFTFESGPRDHGIIDPDTGVFHVDLTFTNDALCGVALDGTVAPDGNSFTATLSVRQITFFSCGPPELFPITGTRCPSCAPFPCGNGTLDDGEECDDSNRLEGDCCSASCTSDGLGASCNGDSNPCTVDQCDAAGTCTVSPSAAGTACPADTSPCTADLCDGAGACTHGPQPSCRAPDRPSSLQARGGTRPRLRYQWTDASGTTSAADFGNPTADTFLRLCVFSNDTLALDALIAPAACGTTPCWSPTGSGYIYRSPSGAPAGLNRIILRSNSHGRTALIAKGKGPALSFLAAPLAPLRAQLFATDPAGTRCWEVQ